VDQEEIAKQALKLPGIESAKILTGGYDLVLEARVSDVDALNALLIKEAAQTPGRGQDTDNAGARGYREEISASRIPVHSLPAFERNPARCSIIQT